MSGDIQELVLNYVQEEVFEDELGKLVTNGVNSIQKNIRYGPHTGLTSYRHGDLFGSVDGDIDSVSQLSAILRFTASAEYASYQDEGTSRGIAPREFMKWGIEDLVEMYR
jgi:hypothetical protein